MLHKLFAESWMQGVLAGFPCGMPGIGLEIEGAVQQAPQSGRHSINITSGDSRYSFRVAEPNRLSAARPLFTLSPFYRRFYYHRFYCSAAGLFGIWPSQIPLA
ncbi:hypothetical protein [Dickeya dadantii]|uniref:hypothetical protein n=1 Tax=Dickeya dadantii TaxID=204038 RepID=UPI00039D8F09|nr:hypothetical protein [Dickeya dadantii]